MAICREGTEQFPSSTPTHFCFASRATVSKRDQRDTLRRRRAFRPPLPRFLIVCEGTQTEPGYFQETRHLERSLIDLEMSPGGEPKALVERAVEKKKSAERLARSQRDSNLRYDQVWCVFDIDEHRLIPEAKQQAGANGIELAISNPCFELWALLHFRDQRAHIERGPSTTNANSTCRATKSSCRAPGYILFVTTH